MINPDEEGNTKSARDTGPQIRVHLETNVTNPQRSISAGSEFPLGIPVVTGDHVGFRALQLRFLEFAFIVVLA